MPSAAKRLCAEPGCAVLVASCRCPQHQTARYRQIERQRGTATQRGYDASWRRVRENVLRRDRHICRVCHERPATEVDHITPMHRGGERLNPANLQAICGRCHDDKTARENSERVGSTR